MGEPVDLCNFKSGSTGFNSSASTVSSAARICLAKSSELQIYQFFVHMSETQRKLLRAVRAFAACRLCFQSAFDASVFSCRGPLGLHSADGNARSARILFLRMWAPLAQ